MSIFDRIAGAFRVRNAAMPAAPDIVTPEIRPNFGSRISYTKTGEAVSEDTANRVSTAYRCANIIADDIASMPLQQFRKVGRSIVQVSPDPVNRNMAYLMEVSPNRWMSPFIFKKLWIYSLIWSGNAYIWQPPQAYRELFLLDPNYTTPGFDENGDLWYKTQFPNGSVEQIPWLEINHLMINSKNGLIGRGVLTFARETIGRQQGAFKTQNRIFASGLTSSAVMRMAGKLNDEARRRVKMEYQAAMSGESNAGGLAVLDETVEKFEVLSMKPTDAQFLESIAATDAEIANFFGLPLYKLNMGKQSYESNEQQNIDYLRTTLNPYLVQIEQGARLKWVPIAEQGDTYFRFIRESLLQTDAKSRATYLKMQIESGQISPNEARQVNDMSAYEGGDAYYIQGNMAKVGADGSLVMGNAGAGDPPDRPDSGDGA